MWTWIFRAVLAGFILYQTYYVNEGPCGANPSWECQYHEDIYLPADGYTNGQ